MKEHWKAIPTSYKGQEFRSRLEANMALTLDRLGVRWEYEPKSFLLPDGTHYRPDFWLPDHRVWFEARGYSNAKGNRQLEGFAEVMPPDHAFLFAAINDPLSPHAVTRWRASPHSTKESIPFAAVYELSHQIDEALCEMGYCPSCDNPEEYEERFAEAYRAAQAAVYAYWDAVEARPKKNRKYPDLGEDSEFIFAEGDLPLRDEIPVLQGARYRLRELDK